MKLKKIRIGLIYKHTNKITGDAYVGQTIKSRQKRWDAHVAAAALGFPGHFYNAIRKYGPENFRHRTLKYVTEPLLNAAEIYFVARHDTFKHGYNMTPGGDGYEMTLAMRRKISKANTGKIRTALAKTRMSDAQIARFKKPKERKLQSTLKLEHYAAHPEAREKTAVAVTTRWQDPVYRARMCAAQQKRWLRPEEHTKHSLAHKKPWSDKQWAAYEANPGVRVGDAVKAAWVSTASKRMWDMRTPKARAAIGRKISTTKRRNVLKKAV